MKKMISGFSIAHKMPDDLRLQRFEINTPVIHQSRDLDGIKEYRTVKLCFLDVFYSFKTYRKFWIGPQVCEPTYRVEVVLSSHNRVWGEPLDVFVNNLDQKEKYSEALKEVFSRLQK